MAKGFLEKGWEVHVATSPTSPPRSASIFEGAHIHEFSIRGSGHPKAPYSGQIVEYRDLLKSGGWDAVVIHAYVESLDLALGILDEIPSKKILVSHGYAALQWVRMGCFPWGLGTWGLNASKAVKMCRWIHKFDRVVYLSEKADFFGFLDHRIAKTVGYPGRTVIPNGVDPQVRGLDPHSFRIRHGIPDDSFLFLCVANYSRRKDQGFAARAFRMTRMRGAWLVFIGSEFNQHSETFKSEDESLAPTGTTGTITWLENVSKEDTLNAYAACDAFVLSANHEAQPIVLLEAMRESKPWIARNAGCISEMPGGITVSTESEMAEKMEIISGDEKLQGLLGGAGRKAVETVYNHGAYKESYVSLMEKTINE